MKFKKFKLFAVFGAFIFFTAGLSMAWYGSASVTKFAGMVDMKIRFNMGEKALKAGQKKAAASRFQEAVTFFRKAHVMPGYYVGVGDDLFVAGNCYRYIGHFQAARNNYLLALDSDPNNISFLTNLGNIDFYRLGKYREAETVLSRCQKIYPSSHKISKTLRLLHEAAKTRGKDGQRN